MGSKHIIGKKLGMTQIFLEGGRAVPATVIEAGPNVVVQKKTVKTDGYAAVQLGFGETAERKLTRPERGHLARAGAGSLRHLREFRVADPEAVEVGQRVSADVFAPGDLVDVTGTSKGKGFAGGVRRHGFGRGPMTHGSKYHRGPGSAAMRTSGGGGKVYKGRRLPGRLGGVRVTVQNLRVLRVDGERNLLIVGGAVPGARGGLVAVSSAVKAPR